MRAGKGRWKLWIWRLPERLPLPKFAHLHYPSFLNSITIIPFSSIYISAKWPWPALSVFHFRSRPLWSEGIGNNIFQALRTQAPCHPIGEDMMIMNWWWRQNKNDKVMVMTRWWWQGDDDDKVMMTTRWWWQGDDDKVIWGDKCERHFRRQMCGTPVEG